MRSEGKPPEGRGLNPGEPPPLPRGPHSLSREQVASNQRRRLMKGMIETVGEHGYTNTTVADVIAHAGVSRKAFYEHFPNREQCFLEAYDRAIAAGIRQIEAAYRSEQNTLAAAEAALEALFEGAIAEPSSVRLVLVEVGAVGAEGIARREQLLATYEELLRETLKLPRGSGAIPNPVLRAMVGGLNEVLYTRVSRRRQNELRKLAPDLVRWATSYYPAPEAIGSLDGGPPMRPLPGHAGGRAPGTLTPPPAAGRRRGLRGEQKGSHSFVVHNQRERILDAVAHLSATKGYGAFTVRDIAETAAVSLDAFYGHFEGKEDAFLVAYEVGHGKGLTLVEQAYGAAPDWRTGIKAAIAALFDFLASEPAFAHLALVDALIATSRTAEHARKGFSAYAHLLVPGLEHAPERGAPPAVTIEAIAGGVFELCLTYTLQGRADELSELLGHTTYFALAPFIGAEEAGRVAIEAASP
jgi:AcrR family transcriptional regulator